LARAATDDTCSAKIFLTASSFQVALLSGQACRLGGGPGEVSPVDKTGSSLFGMGSNDLSLEA
jgi:hypothetical protein